jgi:hypothetical protein
LNKRKLLRTAFSESQTSALGAPGTEHGTSVTAVGRTSHNSRLLHVAAGCSYGSLPRKDMSTFPDSAEAPGAAPSRRSAPRQPLKSLKTLAPKPPQAQRPVSSRRINTTSVSSVVGRGNPLTCPVCRRRACRLSSHKSWAKDSNQPGDGAIPLHVRQNVIKDTPYANSYAYHFAESFVDVGIAAGRVDPFYQLPIPDSTHPQLHRLFHDCKYPPTFLTHSTPSGYMVSNRLVLVFAVQLNRAMNFPRPSCFASDPMGGALAPAAMIDPAVCLSVISMSAIAVGMRLGQPARNASAHSLYGQAKRLVYERLGNSYTTNETIMAAISLLVVSILFGNEAAIRQNRRGVRDLVARRGGPSRLGMGGVLADYIIWAEIFAALWLKDEPFYVSETTPGFLMTPPPVVYGASFSSPPILESLHPSMIEICFTMCRLTEVLEKATREDATPQEFIYFYSTLKWISVRRAQFRASCYNTGTKDECIGIAIEIFRCNVFAAQPESRSLNFNFCSQLRHALMRTDLFSYWNGRTQILIWALFVVGTVEFEGESRQWFMDLLRRSISHRYASEDWPGTWREEALQNLKSFLWSEVRFAESFVKICDEVEQLNALGVGSKMAPGFP